MTNIPCQDFQDRIALAPQRTAQKGRLPRALIKKGGKAKRKATELQEDTLLWAKLRAGTQITRNKRQEERLRQWKESVASEYGGCEALDERKIKCSCGTVFTINKQNAIKDVGRAHVRNCMKANDDRQKQEVKSENLQKYWTNFLKK